jgi:hypothetical protein
MSEKTKRTLIIAISIIIIALLVSDNSGIIQLGIGNILGNHNKSNTLEEKSQEQEIKIRDINMNDGDVINGIKVEVQNK